MVVTPRDGSTDATTMDLEAAGLIRANPRSEVRVLPDGGREPPARRLAALG
jgi:hypothetical protein